MSWAKRHSRRLRNTSLGVSSLFNPDKAELYREDIKSELELFFENGRFSRVTHEHQGPGISEGQLEALCTNSIDCDHHSFETPTPGDLLEPASPAVTPEGQRSRQNDDFEHECASIHDCLLKSSFYHSEFDSEKFLVMAETMMDKVFSRSDDKTTNRVKADIITSLVRKISSFSV